MKVKSEIETLELALGLQNSFERLSLMLFEVNMFNISVRFFGMMM